MSQPTDQHIDAVADFMPTPHGIHARVAARVLLSSTDHAVLDAFEAALIRAGRLTEERCCDHARRELREDGGTRYVICGSYGGGQTCRRRNVTEWREDEP